MAQSRRDAAFREAGRHCGGPLFHTGEDEDVGEAPQGLVGLEGAWLKSSSKILTNKQALPESLKSRARVYVIEWPTHLTGQDAGCLEVHKMHFRGKSQVCSGLVNRGQIV